MPNGFAYKYPSYTPLREREIRIIELLPGAVDDEIHCSLLHASLAERPQYECLSYVWGPEVFDESEQLFITCDGTKVCIRENLWAAFLCLRFEDRPRRL